MFRDLGGRQISPHQEGDSCLKLLGHPAPGSSCGLAPFLGEIDQACACPVYTEARLVPTGHTAAPPSCSEHQENLPEPYVFMLD